MTNVMDVDVGGCILAMDVHPPLTCKYYAGSATALNTEALYPWDKSGILSTGAYQYSLPPMVGMLVKWKTTPLGDAPMVEQLATGGNGNLICGVITHIAAHPAVDAYFDVAVYLFQPGDILKLQTSANGSSTIVTFLGKVGFYTGERLFHLDATNGAGRAISTTGARGDDILVYWVGYSL